jgi:mono/diheme cytochrome c family protein
MGGIKRSGFALGRRAGKTNVNANLPELADGCSGQPIRKKKMKYKVILPTVAFLLMAGTSATTGQTIDAPQLWSKHCAACHGKDGQGKTKAGQKAKVKDLTNLEYQKSFTDEEAFKSTKFGMSRDNRELMKPFEGKLNDEEIKALIVYLRKFAEK